MCKRVDISLNALKSSSISELTSFVWILYPNSPVDIFFTPSCKILNSLVIRYVLINITKANTSHATEKTNKREALVVEEIWLMILPESPTVTEPIGFASPIAVSGEVTLIFVLFVKAFSFFPEYINFPSLSRNSINTISLWLFKILSECF